MQVPTVGLLDDQCTLASEQERAPDIPSFDDPLKLDNWGLVHPQQLPNGVDRELLVGSLHESSELHPSYHLLEQLSDFVAFVTSLDEQGFLVDNNVPGVVEVGRDEGAT